MRFPIKADMTMVPRHNKMDADSLDNLETEGHRDNSQRGRAHGGPRQSISEGKKCGWIISADENGVATPANTAGGPEWLETPSQSSMNQVCSVEKKAL